MTYEHIVHKYVLHTPVCIKEDMYSAYFRNGLTAWLEYVRFDLKKTKF